MAIRKQLSPKRVKTPSIKSSELGTGLERPSFGDHKYTDDELEEIIDAAVNLMEFALQRKSFPIADHPEPKKRLPADKLLYIYYDMQAQQDNESDTSCGDDDDETGLIVEAQTVACTCPIKEETPENDENESQQPLI